MTHEAGRPKVCWKGRPVEQCRWIVPYAGRGDYEICAICSNSRWVPTDKRQAKEVARG